MLIEYGRWDDLILFFFIKITFAIEIKLGVIGYALTV